MKAILLILLSASLAYSLAEPVVDRTLDAPDGNITGLGFGDGSLWALDKLSETVYRLDPVSGAVSLSWVVTQTGTKIPTGCTFLNNYVYVCAGTSTGTAAYGYRYNTGGSYMSYFSLDC